MKVISVFNQKGGVGKTTTVVNLSVALTYLDKKVLVIDMDPQANTTSGFGMDKFNIKSSIYDLFCDLLEKKVLINQASNESNNDEDIDSLALEEESNIGEENSEDNKNSIDLDYDIDNYIIKTASGVDIICSQLALSGIEVELVDMDPYERTQILKEIMQEVRKKSYDYVLIDCSPSLGLLSINALVASNSILIPVQTEYYALEGISELVNTITLVKEELNKDLEIEGILLTMFDKRVCLSYEVAEEIKIYFKDKVFKYMIPRSPRLAESPSYGLSTLQYDPNSQGSYAYMALAEEIINKEREKTYDK